jgi:predicted DCC family thiol-disulfide oxidoreductase YuxK
MMPHPLILFDGVCNFCSFWVRFVIKRDPEKRFRFASLQSGVGQQILREIGLPSGEFNTVILVDGGKHYTKSSATLNIARRMKGLWPLLFMFIVIPSPIRDFFYDIIARNRYRWFGKKESCLVPTPDFEDRFLE